ncbi:la-related protein 6-like [Pempheris klunzingeri]|uniref:la-related protein 6-like n=1 Tax=Pempheris klunzingeri TaxID=3127111 RepID=UPI0039817936
MDITSLSAGHRTNQAHIFSHTSRWRGASDPRGLSVVAAAAAVVVEAVKQPETTAQLSDLLSLLSLADTMNNPIGNDALSAQDEEDREGELLCLKIRDQLEDLFSDSHLAEDGFLLKHVQKNKEGYVSLKLLTCLKKIKVLTTNWYMTLAGAVYSEVLEVNDECTKVRRIEPLPEWLLCSPTSKLLLAWNISVEKTGKDGAARGLEQPSLSERILQKFSAHGTITSVSILHPGKELPKELQCYAKRHKQLGQYLCAVVKFDNLDAVRKAYGVLKAEEEKSDSEGMHVVPLGFQSMHHVHTDESSEINNRDQPGKSQEDPLETSKDSVQEEPVNVSDETPDTHQPQESMQQTPEQISADCHAQSFSGFKQRHSRMSWCSGDCDKDSSQGPWVLRRKFAACALKPKVAGNLNVSFLMQRVLRQPSGPDETKGFQNRGNLLQQEEIKLSLR